MPRRRVPPAACIHCHAPCCLPHLPAPAARGGAWAGQRAGLLLRAGGDAGPEAGAAGAAAAGDWVPGAACAGEESSCCSAACVLRRSEARRPASRACCWRRRHGGHLPPALAPLPQGTYFLIADFAGLLPEGSTEDDVEVRRRRRPTGLACPASIRACLRWRCARMARLLHPPSSCPPTARPLLAHPPGAVLPAADARGGRHADPRQRLLRRPRRRAAHPGPLCVLQDG